MKLRASLRFKPGVLRTPAAQAEASRFLADNDIAVLRVGRTALSVEAEPEALASALDAPTVDHGKSVRLVEGMSVASKWFDLAEITEAPLLFNEGKRA